jgi:23S rRNA (uracil1939-C5)-methyltransferase
MITTTITSLGQRGEGVTDIDGTRVFVPFTLPGERIEIDAEAERGHMVALLEKSADRVEPFCPYFGTCGGCALQHAGPETYAAFKRGLVETALSHAGITVPVAPLVGAQGTGRRRTTLHIRKHGAGYARARTHDILDIAVCPILVPALQKAAPRLAHLLHGMAGDGDVAITATDTGLDLAVKSERKPRPEAIAAFAQTYKLARLAWNGEVRFMARPPAIKMGRALLEPPVGSFLQATQKAEETLSEHVISAVGKAKAVADLFCGVGPFALRLAENARVFAADSDKPATAALAKAVRFTQGLKPVTTLARDLFRDPLAPVELQPYDAVVFDPPRAGAEGQARELARSKVKTVVAVSCEPKTFARDAAILIAGGYRLDSVTPIDQFAWSAHVEVVGVFRR